MQEHQSAAAAEASAPSWYLARGEEQYGPLTDRELLLLAERGGLKGDDLLWRSGFDDWKPVSAVCGVTACAEIPAGYAPPGQDTEYLPTDKASVSKTVGHEPLGEKRSLKARLYEELGKFLAIFAYLWLVFFVFLVHEWTVLASHNIDFRFYGLAVVNALVLSKIMLVAEGLKFAEGLNDKPLIYPIVFKSFAFSVLLVTSYIVEEIAVGLFHGKGVAESIPQIGGGGWAGPITIGAIMCVALVPFFAFKEIARVIGKAEFRALMLGRGRKVERNGLPSAAVLTPAE